MKHLVRIQSEFVKEARQWDELTFEEQQRYLSRHPKSKRRMTSRREMTKVVDKDFDQAQKIIRQLFSNEMSKGSFYDNVIMTTNSSGHGKNHKYNASFGFGFDKDSLRGSESKQEAYDEMKEMIKNKSTLQKDFVKKINDKLKDIDLKVEAEENIHNQGVTDYSHIETGKYYVGNGMISQYLKIVKLST